ncbi:hypothetical protein ACIQPQ_07665 [Streptomyces sp. NPDC091281]|uniref:hypothetical protein n=1 Tax=Streptomyces sp. NPDC091281 TaxID=3365985 RepID=UPI003802FD5A
MEHVAISGALAVFGFLGLFITLMAALLRQLPELFSAWREVCRALRDTPRDGMTDDHQSL